MWRVCGLKSVDNGWMVTDSMQTDSKSFATHIMQKCLHIVYPNVYLGLGHGCNYRTASLTHSIVYIEPSQLIWNSGCKAVRQPVVNSKHVSSEAESRRPRVECAWKTSVHCQKTP